MMKFSFLLVLSIVFELSAAARSVCEDSKKSFRIEPNGTNKNRSCRWAATKSEIRCHKKTVNGTSVKELCPETCGNCPAQGTEQDSISSSEARWLESGGCCTLDYKSCITWCGNTKESCLTCSNTDVGWIPNGAPLGSCAARWSGCGHAKNSCCEGLMCQANTDGWFACLPGESTPTPPNPTNPPVSPTMAPVLPTSPPTNAPQPNPTNPPIPPTVAPVPPTVAPIPPTLAPVPSPTMAPKGNGCCTLDYKSCITWCGNTKESCLTCSNTDVGWIPNGAPLGSCAARWSGCGHAKNSCCEGLTCQANTDGWFACLPGESTPTPPNPTNPPVLPTMAPVLPTSPPTNAPQPNPTNPPIPPTVAPFQPTNPPTNAPQPNPTNAPVPPTAAPVLPTSPPTNPPQPNPTIPPTLAPVPTPTNPPNGNGCCSLDYKNCVSWCGSTHDSCVNCDNNDVVWLPDGPGGTCSERWSGCSQDSGCCNGLTCQWRDGYGYFACLPGGNGTPQSNPTNLPQPSPVAQPTTSPVVQPTPAPAPTTPFSGDLLSTDKAMNAWEVYQGLDYITHKNSESPPNYALVASGGAAGGGNFVVSESQAYSLLITGAVLASWDTHAGQVAGANRNEVLNSFEGYYNFWKDMCKNSSGKSSNCQLGGNYCKSGSNSYVCLPDWRHYKTGGSEATGPAPDADEDAIVGIILAVKAVENDVNKPSWYDEARKWADASASAFYDFEVDKSRGDYRLVKLGSCWGGWDGAGNNPSYHSPGSFRVMKDYQNAFPESDRVGYSAVSQSDWQKLIDTSHEVMRVVQCSNDGALVPNWATIGISGGNLVHTGAGFSGSGTPQYEYGSEAARTTFRVALDAAFYPENSAEWSPYLSQFNYRMDQGFNNGSISSNSFPSCRTPGTSQNINMFGDWQNNAFIFGPTYSALIGASPDVANAEAMIDSVGQKLNTELPGSYYPRSWAMISNLMLNGAMESAGKTLKQ